MNKLNTKLPDSPGIYFFKKGRTVLYIGKATSLRDRVRSYFGNDLVELRGQAIVNMVNLATNISFKKTDSVLEALILESALIKNYQPKYNVREKDDKSYFYVAITKEDFPKVVAVRGKDLLVQSKKNYLDIFGPFPYGGELKEALKIIRKIFPFREKCVPAKENIGKICFEAQIGLCPGVCGGNISKKDYLEIIKNIKLFFKGKKTTVVKRLQRQMNLLAERCEFEKANTLKKQIFGLKHIEDVALIKRRNPYPENINKDRIFRVEAYDISHMSSQDRVGVMTVVENGEMKKSDYRRFKIKVGNKKRGDVADLTQVLNRRFYHEEWRLPDIIVVDGAVAQRNAAGKIVNALRLGIPVVAVTKDEHHKPIRILGDKELTQKHEREILLANAESHRFSIAYHKKLRSLLR